MQRIAINNLASEGCAMWNKMTVLRISGLAILGLGLCHSSSQAQESSKRRMPATDQKASKSFETATFGLG